MAYVIHGLSKSATCHADDLEWPSSSFTLPLQTFQHAICRTAHI